MIPRILYVEDHEDTRVLVSHLLRDAGFDITPAASAADARRLAASRRFDLYLLDNALPDGTGVELCRSITDSAPGAPVLFYSGAALPQARESALAAGARAYLVKPHDVFRLIQQVDRLTHRRPTQEFSR